MNFSLKSGLFLVFCIFSGFLGALSVDAFAEDHSSIEDTPGQAEEIEAPQLMMDEWGSINPGKGFKLADTKYGDLSVSLYLLIRYLNQLPALQTATDHLGNPYNVDTRNDIQLQREMLFFSGWIYKPKLHYQSMIWTVNSTNQVAVAGNLSYEFNKALNLFGGIGALPGTRSLTGCFPYFYGTDRQLADDFFRPGFTGGLWLKGFPADGLGYDFMVGNNLSIIGINSAKLTRELATSFQVWWMPTTHEFGPKEGFSDYEWHDKFATRFDFAFTHSRENRFSQSSLTAPDNTQIRNSDGVLFFQTGAFAPGVTVTDADYYMVSTAAGFKYHGISFNGEYYFRWMNSFRTDGQPVPLSSMYDNGFTLQTGYELLPQRLGVYGVGSYIDGYFNKSYEGGGGVNFYPDHSTRNWRVNFHSVYVHKAAYGSLFGYYVAGETGPIISLATDIFF